MIACQNYTFLVQCISVPCSLNYLIIGFGSTFPPLIVRPKIGHASKRLAAFLTLKRTFSFVDHTHVFVPVAFHQKRFLAFRTLIRTIACVRAPMHYQLGIQFERLVAFWTLVQSFSSFTCVYSQVMSLLVASGRKTFLAFSALIRAVAGMYVLVVGR